MRGFPAASTRLSCSQCKDPQLLLVFSHSDQDPGRFWLYRPATNAWTALGAVRSDIVPARMATLDFMRAKARDGLDLPIWVTTPRKDAPGLRDGKRAAVVLVHGGPWMRGGHWGWDGDAQFLASRGYVVIEPEFRGSTGYGALHFRAGWKKWEGAMQDDVADALNAVAAKGLVDPKRVCIAGASYGGYATLMGMIRYPELYRCGVAWVAVTDPRLLFENSWENDSSEEARNYSMPAMVGDPQQDAAMLKAAAPVERAAEIRGAGSARLRSRRPARAGQAWHADARGAPRPGQGSGMDRLRRRGPRLVQGREPRRLLDPRRALSRCADRRRRAP